MGRTVNPALPPREKGAAYSADLYAWAMEQSAFLRAGAFERLDLDHLAEEIADVGRAEYNKLVGAAEVLLVHLLKWEHQPALRSRSWVNSIAEHRDRIGFILSDNPGLKSKRDEVLARAYRVARSRASTEMDCDVAELPQLCPIDWSQMMDAVILLAPETKAKP
jgi:hypothetical protein